MKKSSASRASSKSPKSLKPKISAVIEALERRAPSSTAEKWDNTGLLAGDPRWETSGAVVSVDLTEQAIRAAVESGARLIVNHHPCIFPKSKGLGRVVSSAQGGMSSLVFEAIRNGVAVASYHTNFDQCALEVVEQIAQGLKIQPKGRLLDSAEGTLLKLVVFVPETHLEAVRAAVAQAGAGHVGNYDFCTFGTSGEGTFRGSDSTRPFIGRPGRLEKVKEVRLETVFPRGLRKAVLTAVRAAHPYEEVALDLYPLELGDRGLAPAGLVRGLGYGFWGDFPSPRPFSDVMRSVKGCFETNGYFVTAPLSVQPEQVPKRTAPAIKRVGFVAGKGASFVDAASAAGCDLFITGEVGYHGALEGARKGMTVVELGHRESEVFFLKTMKEWLTDLGLKTVSLNLKTQSIVGDQTRRI